MEQLLTIIEASQLSGKSIQTIRRMIKQHKIRVKKQRTPQGFNYMIIKESLFDFLNNQPLVPTHGTTSQPLIEIQENVREHRTIETEEYGWFKTEIQRFNSTVEKLVEQNEKDKRSFFDLIKTFQDRALMFENEVKMLKAPKPWWKLW